MPTLEWARTPKTRYLAVFCTACLVGTLVVRHGMGGEIPPVVVDAIVTHVAGDERPYFIRLAYAYGGERYEVVCESGHALAIRTPTQIGIWPERPEEGAVLMDDIVERERALGYVPPVLGAGVGLFALLLARALGL